MALPPLTHRLAYNTTYIISRFISLNFLRLRLFGTRNIPSSSGGLICGNHQSFLDPILYGLASPYRLNYLARKTLFEVPILKEIIPMHNAIPIDRDGMGLQGIKTTLKRLKEKELVLIFPEGTRSSDGELLPLKTGFCTLARRAKTPLIPAGIDGPFTIWPRHEKLPHRLAQVCICYGRPIESSEYENLSDEELTAELASRIQECFEKCRKTVSS